MRRRKCSPLGRQAERRAQQGRAWGWSRRILDLLGSATAGRIPAVGHQRAAWSRRARRSGRHAAAPGSRRRPPRPRAMRDDDRASVRRAVRRCARIALPLPVSHRRQRVVEDAAAARRQTMRARSLPRWRCPPRASRPRSPTACRTLLPRSAYRGRGPPARDGPRSARGTPPASRARCSRRWAEKRNGSCGTHPRAPRSASSV